MSNKKKIDIKPYKKRLTGMRGEIEELHGLGLKGIHPGQATDGGLVEFHRLTPRCSELPRENSAIA